MERRSETVHINGRELVPKWGEYKKSNIAGRIGIEQKISFLSLCRFFITKLNSVALVRERTIPTERPPPVGEVSANFCG
jgi:hypothetical protein